MLKPTLAAAVISALMCASPVQAQRFPGEAGAKPTRQPHVELRVWFDRLTLPPGGSGTWFEDNVAQNVVRTFTAVPLSTDIDRFVPYDQVVEVTNVFYILKGGNHATDGSGGQGTLQLNVTVLNRDKEHPITFKILRAEMVY